MQNVVTKPKLVKGLVRQNKAKESKKKRKFSDYLLTSSRLSVTQHSPKQRNIIGTCECKKKKKKGSSDIPD